MIYSDEERQQHLRDAKSAVRWIAIAVFMMFTSVVSQVVALVMMIKRNPNTKIAIMVCLGSFVLGRYAKWCSDSVKPRYWNKR